MKEIKFLWQKYTHKKKIWRQCENLAFFKRIPIGSNGKNWSQGFVKMFFFFNKTIIDIEVKLYARNFFKLSMIEQIRLDLVKVFNISMPLC